MTALDDATIDEATDADAPAPAAPARSTALAGLVALDLTRVRAGPTCTRILADFGADVIRIEAPSGVDPNEMMSGARDGFDNLNLHRNKRSVSLNLKAPEGLALFKRMVAGADVVVENYRPDVKTRLGIDYPALKAINPRIILASVSGFGQTGPAAHRAGFDQIAQGMGGLMWITGEEGRGPMRAGIATADSAAGMNAAIGVLIALAERERSGEGQWVHTSLLQSQIALNCFQAARYLVDGVAPGQAGNDHPYSTPMGLAPTKDGFINIGVGGDGQWRALCRALERPDLAADPAYATGDGRFKNRPKLRVILDEAFRAKSSAEWLDILERESVPAGPVHRMDEVFADPQVTHLGMAAEVTHPTRGPVKVVNQPIVMSRTPAAIVSAARERGADNAAVLGRLGLSDEDIAELQARRII